MYSMEISSLAMLLPQQENVFVFSLLKIRNVSVTIFLITPFHQWCWYGSNLMILPDGLN